jgi:hypothetical protein
MNLDKYFRSLEPIFLASVHDLKLTCQYPLEVFIVGLSDNSPIFLSAVLHSSKHGCHLSDLVGATLNSRYSGRNDQKVISVVSWSRVHRGSY